MSSISDYLQPCKVIYSIQSKIEYILKHLSKSQGVIVLVDIDKSEIVSTVPMSTRGNKSYAWHREKRVNEIQEAVNQLVRARGERTNAFLTTLTYETPQFNPPQSHITAFRRQLKKHGIAKCILCIECHKDGKIHYHAVIIADKQYKFYGHVDNDGKKTYRSNTMRTIIRECWKHGHVDVQAITTPDGAGRYVMKEIGKYSHVENAIKKWQTGEQLSKGDIQRVHLFYFAVRHKRRLLSVSKGLPKLAEVSKDDADLITLSNKSFSDRAGNSLIVPVIILKAEWIAMFGRPPPILTKYEEEDENIKAKLLEMAGEIYLDRLRSSKDNKINPLARTSIVCQ